MKPLFFMIMVGLAFVTAAQAGNGRKEKKANAALQGTVADAATRKPLTGVTVSISGRGNDKKELATDAQGAFKATALVPGEVTILLEKKGYQTLRKEGVAIREGAMLKLTMEMEEEEDVAEEVFHPLLRLLQGE